MELKRAKVIMLPTRDCTPLMVCNKYKKDNKLLPNGDVSYLSSTYNSEELVAREYEYQHLYITIDDEIKEGDWFYHAFTKDIRQAVKITGTNIFIGLNDEKSNYIKTGCKKIIATTDFLEVSLGKPYRADMGVIITPRKQVPQPSKALIEKYCKMGGIDEVDVEYWLISKEHSVTSRSEIELKVDNHNTITIYPIKDNWNREEVLLLLDKVLIEYSDKVVADIPEWISKNL